MSIPRAVLHCKDVLQLLDRELAAPRKGVCVKQLLDVWNAVVWLWLSQDAWEVLVSPLCCAGVCHPHAQRPQFSPRGHCASLSLCLHLIRKPHQLSLCDLDSSVPCGTTNAPSLVEGSHSCCAVTYLCSRQSPPRCHHRTLPHPARSRLHRYPHPRSGNPRDRKGWAEQANTQ